MIRAVSLILLLLCLGCTTGAGAGTGTGKHAAVSPVGAWFCKTDEGSSTILLHEDGTALLITVAGPGAYPEATEYTWSQACAAVVLEADGLTRSYTFDGESLTLRADDSGDAYEPSEELEDLVPREEASPQGASREGNSPLRALASNP